MSLRRVERACALSVEEASQAAVARQTARSLAASLDSDVRHRLDLVVSEAATNVARHAGNGELLLTKIRQAEDSWIELLALDHGPGIDNLGRALAGGRSTGGGLGEGLGAIRRLADDFAISAPPGIGTAVFARLGDAPELMPNRARVGAVERAKYGQRQCGDAWGARTVRQTATLAVLIDGVGHGPAASEASDLGLEALGQLRVPQPAAALHYIHEALRSTRGAAAAVALVEPQHGRLTFAGVGNISAAVIEKDRRRGLVSLNGTLGFGAIKTQEFVVPWERNSMLILHSDGVSSRWDVASLTGAPRRHPGLAAGIIYRDHAYAHDDATVLVLRRPHEREG